MSFFESLFYMAWRGLAIGLIISAPMGPVGMLCIQRTLDKGRRAGFYTGIGAALSDLFYSLLTGFGLSFIEDFLERNQSIIQLIGSIVLIAFGIYLFRNNPSKRLKKPVDEDISVEKSILGGFLFTFSNPLILFLIIGLFARFNFILPATSDGAWLLHLIQYIIGFVSLFAGALLWWWFITFSIDKVRSHFNLRSMWLINKIIGGIILLFAVVGIFTATSALAKGEGTRCWNARRGLEPFATEGSRMKNTTGDTMTLMTACSGAESVEWRCKVKNHKTGKAWGFRIEPNIYIDIRAAETEYDGVSTAPALEVEIRQPGAEASRKSFADKTDILRRFKGGMSGPDPTGANNFFKIAIYADQLSLFGGEHSPELLMSAALPENFRADSIGFYLTPGAEIAADEIRLTCGNYDGEPTIWSDPELLEEYLDTSADPMEGYWQILDRSMEESLLRPGGDYGMAMVKADDGYDLIYLGGGAINAARWQRGMVKASLRPSGILGIWNLTWHDAMHRTMDHDLKAQIDPSGSLLLLFPYQNSQLRLTKTEKPWNGKH